jgi:diguanylate cyclase (GGDEF)-like protein/PAS domain S-box-containing protein
MPPPSLALPRRAVTDDLRRMHVHLLFVAAGLLALEAVGLFAGWEVVTRVRPEWPQIYPYTVAGGAVLVAAMALLRIGGRAAQVIGMVLAGITAALGAAVDVAVGAGLLPSTDQVTGDSAGWITALPSVAIVVLALSVLLIPVRNPLVARCRFWAAALAGVVSLLVVLSYLYGADKLTFGLGETGTSLAASILGMIMVGASMTARPDLPPLASLDQRYDRGLLRAIVPLLVIAPFVPALVEWAVASFVSDPASAAAISQLVTVVILVGVIAIMGGAQSRARRELTMQRQRVWDAFEHTPAATAVVTVDGRIATANGALATLTARSPQTLVGTMVADLVADPDLEKVAEALAEVAAGRDGFRRDVRFRGSGRVSIWVDLNLAPVRDSSGRVTYMILQLADLSDRKHLERVLAEQSIRDPLTGLLNREGLDRQIEILRLDRVSAQDMVVVYADVDDLKSLNDTAGHAAGDDLLREVARRLRACTRADDILARIGGDEFVIVTTTSPGDAPTADAVVSRLRALLCGPAAAGRDIVPLTVSLGASSLRDFADTTRVIAQADEAMYVDKRRRATDHPG